MKKFFQEFKEFAMRGNVVDMAVGVMIGAAFKSIVDSFINDIISPVIGLFMNDSLHTLSVTIGMVTINYGAFITAIMNFVIMAFILFIVIKLMNKMKKQPEQVEIVAEPSDEVKLLTEIRDALKK
ncbi:large conductance mechanosensitive channel protein MscL [Anaerorhabdus furcosa]|uniref:Large-conductance mechanosensitive channel n=1 Tax=Anaerorhabdus furcosa TaxID=118967 RepID=A0A1T4NVW3_9FIRM|nr:large conductance mechanosensitive channel protein MscL [Anaerorhabdus furcosa]SJZ82888.1 large conductance mechanosensitive channel [Anaerorhabdus furcosa]